MEFGVARDLITPDVKTHLGGYEVDGSVIEFCLKGRLKKGVNAKMQEAFGENLRRGVRTDTEGVA